MSFELQYLVPSLGYLSIPQANSYKKCCERRLWTTKLDSVGRARINSITYMYNVTLHHFLSYLLWSRSNTLSITEGSCPMCAVFPGPFGRVAPYAFPVSLKHWCGKESIDVVKKNSAQTTPTRSTLIIMTALTCKCAENPQSVTTSFLCWTLFCIFFFLSKGGGKNWHFLRWWKYVQ